MGTEVEGLPPEAPQPHSFQGVTAGGTPEINTSTPSQLDDQFSFNNPSPVAKSDKITIPSPEPFADNPAAVVEFEHAKKTYLEALNGDDMEKARVSFLQVIAKAAAVSRILVFQEGFFKAKQEQDRLEYIVKTNPEYETSEIPYNNLDAKGIASYEAAKEDLPEKKRQAEAWLTAKDKALSRFEELVLDTVAESAKGPGDIEVSREEVVLPTAILSEIGQAMFVLGETKKAQEYYNAASKSSDTIVQSAWYRLEALRIAAAEDPKKAAAVVKEVEKIRSGLPQLYIDAMIDETAPRNGGAVLAGEGDALPYNPGKTKDIIALDAFSWGIFYESMFASLGDPDLKQSDVEKRLAEIEGLEDERRKDVIGRIGQADRFEAQLHLNNMELVAAAWTRNAGIIEDELRRQGKKDARILYEKLFSDLRDIKKLTESFVDKKPGDRFFEKLATIEWQVALDANRSRDLPQDGLRALVKVIPNYEGSKSIKAHLAALRQEAAEYNIEKYLFHSDGTINPDIDVSKLKVGKSAGDRTRSAYLISNSSSRELWAPLIAGSGCGGAALYFTRIPWVAGLAGAECAALVAGGNRGYNTYVLAAEPYRQARMTGMSNISEEDASHYRSMWYWQEAPQVAVNLVPIGGVLGIGAARITWGGFRTALSSLSKIGLSKESLFTVGRGFKAVGNGFMRIPIGDKIRLGIGLGYPADKYFIDGNYNLTWDPEGKVDTAIGYIGKTALMSELAYRGFKLTWREGLPKTILKKDGTKVVLKGFGNQLKENPWRAGVVRGGADAALADYYILKNGPKGIELVDFDAPRDTPRKERAYEQQFGVDNWLGYAGLAAMFGDWAITEYKSFPMYLNSTRQVRFAQGRILTGAGLVAADFLEDRDFNRWYYGGLGGGLLMNEAGSIMLEVDAWGSMVATGFRIGWEWLVQWQQDTPFADPDPARITWASFDSTVMRFPSKWFVMGNRYLKNFPLGRRMMTAQSWMLDKSRPAFIQTVGNSMRSIEGIAGSPKLLPDSKALKPIVMKADKTKTITLKKGADGENLQEPINFKLLKQGKAGKRHAKVAFLKGKEETVFTGTLPKEYTELLQNNGYFFKDGKLHEFEVQYVGAVRLGVDTRRITAQQLAKMTPEERAPILNELAKQGVFYDETQQKMWQRWFDDPAHPKVLSSSNHYTDGPVSNDGAKVLAIPLKKGGEVWVALSRGQKDVDGAWIGGHEFKLFYGNLRKPRLLWGIPIQGGLMMLTAYELNQHLLQRTMYGDPEYQKMARVWQYGVSEFLVHPLVMWPMGFDTAKAQFIGRLLGTITCMTGNELFPTYLNTWPGLPTYYSRLDGVKPEPAAAFMDKLASYMPFRDWRVRNEPLDSFANTMSSSQLFPVDLGWGKSSGDIAYFEPRAMETFRQAEKCQRDMLSGVKVSDSMNCSKLPQKTYKEMEKQMEVWAEKMKRDKKDNLELLKGRINMLTANFRNWMLREKTGDLSEMERHSLIIMAAHIKSTLSLVSTTGNDKQKDCYKAWYNLQRDYGEILFDKIPVPANPNQWQSFIIDVNHDTTPASDFHYYVK